MRSISIMTKPIALFFISLALAATGRAQDTLTLETAVATALRNNYEILLSKNDSAIAAINYEYRNAAFYPRLNASGTVLF